MFNQSIGFNKITGPFNAINVMIVTTMDEIIKLYVPRYGGTLRLRARREPEDVEDDGLLDDPRQCTCFFVVFLVFDDLCFLGGRSVSWSVGRSVGWSVGWSG